MVDEQVTPSKAHYLSDFSRLLPNGNPYWLNQIRESGLALFRETNYPNTRMEEWRQTNIAPIVETPYRSLVNPTPHTLNPRDIVRVGYASESWHELVFVDGYYAPDLSNTGGLPEGAYVGSIAKALHGPRGESIRGRLNGLLRDRNTFTALNTAFLQDGGLVYLAPNTFAETPIHVLFLTTRSEPNWAAHLRLLLWLEDGAQASVAVSYVSLTEDTPYFNNVVEEISLGANAQLKYCKVTQEGAVGKHLATTELYMNRDSGFTGSVFTLSGDTVRNQICAELDGEGVSCLVTGLYLNDGKRLIDNTLSLVHTQPHGTSRIHWKGILEDTSKAVFTGKVYVHPEAQKTDSNQLNNTLLLSDNATIDTKPQLEIYADDVKCTHGATVGPPPPEVMFYFLSRGIGADAARSMLTCGFAEEMVMQAPMGAIRDRLTRYVYNHYNAARLR